MITSHRSAQLLRMDRQFVQMSLQFRQTSVGDPQTSQDSAWGWAGSRSGGLAGPFVRTGRGGSSLVTPQHMLGLPECDRTP